MIQFKWRSLFVVLSFLPACGTAKVGTIESPVKRGPAAYLDEDNDTNESGLFVQTPNFKLAKSEHQYNKVMGIYSNADAPPVAEVIDIAKTSIDIEIYEMEDPDVLQALLRALDRKVQVRVIKEPSPVGDECDLFQKPKRKKTKEKVEPPPECNIQKEIMSKIERSKGGRYVAFNKRNLCSRDRSKFGGHCFQHGKMIIVDDLFVLLSTGNFNPSSLCNLSAKPEKCNRDYSYITRDKEVVTALKEVFEKDLRGIRYDLPAILFRGQLRDKITVSPHSFEPLADFIRSASKSIQIQNQYLRDDDLASVIIEKAKAGVKVELFLSDVCNFGPITEKLAMQSDLMFRALTEAGVEVKMFYKGRKIHDKPGYLHSKAIVVDGDIPDRRKAWIGSINGSPTSLRVNREFGIFFNNSRRVTELSEFMKKDFMDANNITWQKSVLECPRQKIREKRNH